MALCGFGSRKRLTTARDKAIAAGWLHYEPGRKSKPGRYWVTLPDGLSFADDGSCCESDLTQRIGTANQFVGNESEQKAKLSGNDSERKRGAMRNGKSAPSVPIPIPNPKQGRRPVFVPPSVDQIAEYAKEYESKKADWPKRRFDAEAFYDHYTANGWKQKGGNPIKDWKATVRNWGRNDFGNAGNADRPSVYKDLSKPAAGAVA